MNQNIINACLQAGLTPKFLEDEVRRALRGVLSNKNTPEDEVNKLCKEALNEKVLALSEFYDFPKEIIRQVITRWGLYQVETVSTKQGAEYGIIVYIGEFYAFQAVHTDGSFLAFIRATRRSYPLSRSRRHRKRNDRSKEKQ